MYCLYTSIVLIVLSVYKYRINGVFNLCQHFEISHSRNANKHITTGVGITINDNYR